MKLGGQTYQDPGMAENHFRVTEIPHVFQSLEGSNFLGLVEM
jgi:hypothetical protein